MVTMSAHESAAASMKLRMSFPLLLILTAV
jgi:hypothetical protein